MTCSIPRLLLPALVLWLAGCAGPESPATVSPANPADELSVVITSLEEPLETLADRFTMSLARDFVRSAAALPRIEARVLYVRPQDGAVLTPEDFNEASVLEQAEFQPRTYEEQFYYFTRYGSPLYYAPALEILAEHGLTSVDGKDVIDFGFGGIGQLRMLASLGAHVTGIEVDAVTEQLYSQPGDTGVIERAPIAGAGEPGSVELVYGEFPADADVAGQIEDGRAVLFLARNVLKRGYIHPKRPFRDSMEPLIDLQVSDEEYLRAVYRSLRQGGFFMVYNLNPTEAPQGEEGWVPWSDGRCPFERELLEKVGFRVLAYNEDDSQTSMPVYSALGMGELEEARRTSYSMYTLVQKPVW